MTDPLVESAVLQTLAVSIFGLLIKTYLGAIYGYATDKTDLPAGDGLYSLFVGPLLVTGLTAYLDYHWQIWLEKKFPTRPPVFVAVSRRKKRRDSDLVEKEVVITKANVPGTPVSLVNIVVKWMFDMTFGSFWRQGAMTLLSDALLKFTLEKLLPWNIIWTVLTAIVHSMTSWFGFRPLASFLSFLVVSAQGRTVFLAGYEVLWYVLWGLLLYSVDVGSKNMQIAHVKMDNVATEVGWLFNKDFQDKAWRLFW